MLVVLLIIFKDLKVHRYHTGINLCWLGSKELCKFWLQFLDIRQLVFVLRILYHEHHIYLLPSVSSLCRLPSSLICFTVLCYSLRWLRTRWAGINPRIVHITFVLGIVTSSFLLLRLLLPVVVAPVIQLHNQNNITAWCNR